MTTGVLRHADCAAHDMGGGHPESPARMQAVDRALDRIEPSACVQFEAPLASIEALKKIHGSDYVDRIVEAAPTTGRVSLDGDTAMNAYSLAAAQRSTGATLAAVDAVVAGTIGNAFCAVRPPGHHAESERAMGFCLFNSVAAAAAHALDEHGFERVAILDFDVHHGNGTEDIFRDESRVLFCSTYQNPLFPFPDDTSVPGRLIKTPLAAGEGREAFRRAVQRDWLPALDAYQPQLILVSAGFDAHRDDPLANLMLDADDFAWVGEQIAGVARQYCAGKMVATLEGGYDLSSLTESCTAYLQTLVAHG